jgi:O-6-methylguanine DNA methyltransferase
MDDFNAMRDLRAPAGFVDRVLRRVGLLDGYALVTTPLGPAFVAMSDDGITAVARAGDDDEAEFVRGYAERVGRKLERRDELAAGLQAALSGDESEVRVDLRACNAFQRDVLEAARHIPAGGVRPYSWIAQRIGRPGAVRAVGTALAKNPVPLLVPCHRVVRSDGSIGEYVFGSENKAALLQREGVDLEEVRQRLPLRAVWHVEGEDTYCHPFCFDARPLTEMTFTVFESEHDAREHGLHACPSCHPAVAA